MAGVLKPLRLVWQSRAMVELVSMSFVYAAVQVCLMSYLVVYLHDTLGWSLVASGLALSVTTLGGVIGRIVWGTLADRWLQPRRVLGTIGAIACVCGGMTALAEPHWPTFAFLAIAALFGATAIGWNGVQLSELARRSPPGMAAAITGASGFISFGGVMLGPVLFAALGGVTGSYRTGFAMCALVSGATAAVIGMRQARAR